MNNNKNRATAKAEEKNSMQVEKPTNLRRFGDGNHQCAVASWLVLCVVDVYRFKI